MLERFKHHPLVFHCGQCPSIITTDVNTVSNRGRIACICGAELMENARAFFSAHVNAYATYISHHPDGVGFDEFLDRSLRQLVD